MGNINRRLFLRNTAAAGAVVATAAGPAIVEAAPMPSVDLTAISTETVEKIKAWQEANRASVRAHNAYSESLRAKPLDKAECDRCWEAARSTSNDLGLAREIMISALRRI